MATHQDPSTESDYESETHEGSEEGFAAALAPAPPHSRPRAGFSAGMLLLFGFALTGFGTALTIAPQISWQLTKIAQTLSGMGLASGAVLVGGLSLFGMGLLARSIAFHGHVADESQDESEFLLVADELATDLAQVRTSVLQISEELTAMSEHQTAFFQRQAQMEEQAPKSDQQHNALFRLAASLDKLNAQLEERFHALDVQFRSRFDSFSATLQETQSAVDNLKLTPLGVPHPMDTPVHEEAEPVVEESLHTPLESPLMEETTEEIDILVDLQEDTSGGSGEGPEMEFFETMEELDAIVTEQQHLDTSGNPIEPPSALPAQDEAQGESLDALLPDDAIRRAVDHEKDF